MKMDMHIGAISGSIHALTIQNFSVNLGERKMKTRPIDANQLYRIEKLLDTDIVKKDKVASELLEQVLYDIQHMPTLTPQNEWVSVYDRLPEPGERVLATDCGFVGEFYINKRGKWQRYNVNCSELLMALDILYWMPLPAPPDRRPPEGEET